MSALTRIEAEQRAAAIKVDRYRIQLDLTEPGELFTSTTTITFAAHESHTFIEVVCVELLEATVDGDPLPADAFADDRLQLRGLTGTHELVVRARMRYSHDGEGLHKFVDPSDGATYLCATSSVDNAKRWFACFDQPDLKARVSLEVECPPEWTVVGNGAASTDRRGAWQLAETPPISTYLVAVVAGPWHSVRAEHDGIPLALHARRTLSDELDRDADDLFSLTANSFDAFHELFEVRYPFGEYHQAFVPEFNWGAMENPGCVTFRDQMIFRAKPTEAELLGRATTIVHEMAHMWFGNLVTMRWWDDLWLNESFAEYLGHQVAGQITDLPVWPDFSARRKVGGYAADRRRTTHPIAGNGAPDARAAIDDFDAISYAKGASVVRGLATYLGDEMFFGGLHDHIRAHEYGNATFDDLLASWTAHAGPATPSADDLARWAREWLRTPGVDVLAVELGTSGAVLTRKPPVIGPPAQRPHAMTVAVVPGGPSVDVVLDGDSVPVPIGAVGADQIVLANAGDQTWATVELAASHWQRLPAVLSVLTDGPARGVLWSALRTAVADGAVSPALAVQTVVAGMPGEIDVVAERLLPWITDAVTIYVAPGAERDEALATLTGATWGLLTDASPGSSRQVTAARGWLAVTVDLHALRGWTAGDAGIEGLVVDDELRWAVLARRAALGDLSPDEIAAAYAADRSASGLVHAASCRALRPDAAAKAAAWASLVDPASGLSQYELGALAGGIWVAGQEDLVAPYAQRWFDEIPATAAFRSGWALTRIAAACFPARHVEVETLERAEQLAARTDVPSGLRRVASDGADDLRRAIAVRATRH